MHIYFFFSYSYFSVPFFVECMALIMYELNLTLVTLKVPKPKPKIKVPNPSQKSHMNNFQKVTVAFLPEKLSQNSITQ